MELYGVHRKICLLLGKMKIGSLITYILWVENSISDFSVSVDGELIYCTWRVTPTPKPRGCVNAPWTKRAAGP